MKLSLIGMSGVGKTFWAKQLESHGFKRISCDDLIEKKLEKELKKLGYFGINDVAKWMGQPFDLRYKENSEKYLEFEKESMKEIYDSIMRKENKNEKIVIDTTGSVIYIEENFLQILAKHTKIIFLDTPESVIQEMYEIYIQDPKPVFWGNAFVKQPGETDMQALKRCYPQFLQFRVKQYRKLAHIQLDYYVLRNNSNADHFINLLNIYD